jgi:hypothetical protein
VLFAWDIYDAYQVWADPESSWGNKAWSTINVVNPLKKT